MIYDYIIVGAGIGGLSSGLNLALHDKKVLILEKNSLPGGLATTFKRGRFEFDTSIYELYDYGNIDHEGNTQRLFEKYGIDVPVFPLTKSKIHFTTPDEVLDVSENIEEFILELEKLKNGSVEPLKDLLKVISEVHEGFISLQNDTYEEGEYPLFDKYLTMSAKEAMLDLKIPKETIERFSFLWIYLGSPIHKLSFIDFADFMYRYIFKKPIALGVKNLDLVLQMVHHYQKFGGKIYYRSYVQEILNNENIKEVKTSDGKVYKAKHLICDVSKRYAYTHLIDEDKKVNQLIQAQTLSFRGFMVYLGLNKDCSSLGLDTYHYYQFLNRSGEVTYKSMNNLYHNTWEAIVPNVICENASPKGTTILVLKVNFGEKAWSEITNANYEKTKKDLALYYIHQFEETFKIDIQEYIEEIEIATPVTISRFTNNVDGSMLGSMRLGLDNVVHRIISRKEEEIAGISFVGGDSIFGAGAHNALYSGYFLTEKLLEKENYDGE